MKCTVNIILDYEYFSHGMCVFFFFLSIELRYFRPGDRSTLLNPSPLRFEDDFPRMRLLAKYEQCCSSDLSEQSIIPSHLFTFE